MALKEVVYRRDLVVRVLSIREDSARDAIDRQNHGRGIIEYAREHHADLVVLGTRGRSNLRYVLLGSTAERVIREMECSILAVKPSGFSIER